jgi:hypothetical protein
VQCTKYKNSETNQLATSDGCVKQEQARQNREREMTQNFQDIQKFGKEQFETATAATTSFTKSLQEIATETADYSKKSFEKSSALVEKLLGVKSYESAVQLQTEYWKSAYADFVAEATKLSELYSGLAKDAFKPVKL